jgi:hypothetical protein
VPAKPPQAILSSHGLRPAEVRLLDAEHGVNVTAWRMAAKKPVWPGTSPRVDRLPPMDGIKAG